MWGVCAQNTLSRERSARKASRVGSITKKKKTAAPSAAPPAALPIRTDTMPPTVQPTNSGAAMQASRRGTWKPASTLHGERPSAVHWAVISAAARCQGTRGVSNTAASPFREASPLEDGARLGGLFGRELEDVQRKVVHLFTKLHAHRVCIEHEGDDALRSLHRVPL